MAGDINVCVQCPDNFIVNNKCKKGEKYWHPVCVNTEDNVSNFISKYSDSVHWFCEACNHNVRKALLYAIKKLKSLLRFCKQKMAAYSVKIYCYI